MPQSSPTLAAQRKSLLEKQPEAKWIQYEPMGRDNVREGAKLAFGEYLDAVYRFEQADVVIVPVLPSPIDIRAAGHFIGELMMKSMLKTSRVGLVANRVREQTLIFQNLEKFLKKLDIPVITRLRDSQNYIRAAEGGFGIFEMSPYQVDKDIEQWRPLIKWIEKV